MESTRLNSMQSRKRFTLDPKFVETAGESDNLTMGDVEQFLTEWDECNPELVSVSVELDDSSYVHS
jgi:hypothetical protein